MGAELITISVDRLDKARGTVKKQKLTFPVLSDANGDAVRAYNVLNESANIARVATFIVDGDGVITYRYVGANKSDRPTAKVILEQLAVAKG